jgi:hypothetical protein
VTGSFASRTGPGTSSKGCHNHFEVLPRERSFICSKSQYQPSPIRFPKRTRSQGLSSPSSVGRSDCLVHSHREPGRAGCHSYAVHQGRHLKRFPAEESIDSGWNLPRDAQHLLAGNGTHIRKVRVPPATGTSMARRDAAGPAWTRSLSGSLRSDPKQPTRLAMRVLPARAGAGRERIAIEMPQACSRSRCFSRSAPQSAQKAHWSPEPCAQVRVLPWALLGAPADQLRIGSLNWANLPSSLP